MACQAFMTIKTYEQIIGKMAQIVAVFKGVTRSTYVRKNSSQFKNYAMLLKCLKKPSGVYEMQERLVAEAPPGPRWESLQCFPQTP